MSKKKHINEIQYWKYKTKDNNSNGYILYLKNIIENIFNIKITKKKNFLSFNEISTRPISKNLIHLRNKLLVNKIKKFLTLLNINTSEKKILNLIKKHDKVFYIKNPIKNNYGGIGFNNSLFLFIFINSINLKTIIQSVVDDFNNIYIEKRGIKIQLIADETEKNFKIIGIENRIEQMLANLLDNAISFSENNQKILVEIKKDQNGEVILKVIDQGQGFKEKNLNKIFNRFYSNRPDKFGEHSGLGLNIVKNLVELHGGIITATNNKDKKGASVEIAFPKV